MKSRTPGIDAGGVVLGGVVLGGVVLGGVVLGGVVLGGVLLRVHNAVASAGAARFTDTGVDDVETSLTTLSTVWLLWAGVLLMVGVSSTSVC